MSLARIAGSLFGTKPTTSPDYDIQKLIATGSPTALKRHFDKNPTHVVNAIPAFKQAHFERFYTKPEDVQENFLQNGIFLLRQFQQRCPKEAWTVFNNKDSKREFSTAHWIASLGGNGRHPLAKELSSQMLNLAQDAHSWTQDATLPVEQQFFHRWMEDQAEPGFHDHRPRVSAQELSRWMFKTGTPTPTGWEERFMFLALTRDFIRTGQDAHLLLNRPGLNLYTKFDTVDLTGTPLEGTKGNNILHMVALLQRHDQRFLFEALNELHFRDSPNSAGLYGAQAIMDLPGEINTKYGVRPAFGMQLPSLVNGDHNEHPFEKLAVLCELQGLNKDAHHLRLSLHATTNNVPFQHFRNVAEYAMYNNMPDCLQAAMDLGDQTVARYTMQSGVPKPYHPDSVRESILYEALTRWNAQPDKCEAVLCVLLNVDKNSSTHKMAVEATVATFLQDNPTVSRETLPAGPHHLGEHDLNH